MDPHAFKMYLLYVDPDQVPGKTPLDLDPRGKKTKQKICSPKFLINLSQMWSRKITNQQQNVLYF